MELFFCTVGTLNLPTTFFSIFSELSVVSIGLGSLRKALLFSFSSVGFAATTVFSFFGVKENVSSGRLGLSSPTVKIGISFTGEGFLSVQNLLATPLKPPSLVFFCNSGNGSGIGAGAGLFNSKSLLFSIYISLTSKNYLLGIQKAKQVSLSISLVTVISPPCRLIIVFTR